MRTTLAAMLLFLAAAAANAQTTAPPDYSADHLRQIFATTPGDEPLPQRNVHFGFGTIEFRALGMNWRIGFLPFLAPLPGSVPGTTNHMPDAFALNHVVIPGAPPPPPERTADMRRELRRIARLTAGRNQR